MGETLTHVKSLTNPSYIGAWTLAVEEGVYSELTVVVVKVVQTELTHKNVTKTKPVVHLKDQLPFVLNLINRERLEVLFGSVFVERWPGRKFTLYVDTIRHRGKPTPALRVRETYPDFNPNNRHWDSTISALKEGKTTTAAILQNVSLTAENRALIEAAEGSESII